MDTDPPILPCQRDIRWLFANAKAAGRPAPSSAQAQAFDWHTLLVEEPGIGADLFRRLLQTLAEVGGYHHILLDASHGITDLGGLMAALLSDATVLVGSYDRQCSAGLLHATELCNRQWMVS